MNVATMAGALSTLIFVGSTLPMVVRAARTRDVSSYSRGHLVMTNAGNAVHTVYVASLPLGPVWLLHLVHACVSGFMLAAHLWWAPAASAGVGAREVGGSQPAHGLPRERHGIVDRELATLGKA